MAAPLLTRGEWEGRSEWAGKLVAKLDLGDPVGWVDLTTCSDLTLDVAQRRGRSGNTPARTQVFRWPKEKADWRPLAWFDHFDHVIYRAATGRTVGTIEAGVDRSSVSPLV